MTAAAPAAGPVRAHPTLLASIAAAAAAGLAISSSGSMVVAAALLGVAALDRRSVAAAVLAAGAVGVRFATTDLGDLAGIQSVLGSAGEIGPPAAAASAWTAAAALVLASVPRPSGPPAATDEPTPQPSDGPTLAVPVGIHRALVALAGGALAAAVAVGPGPGGELVLRVAATAAATALALVAGAATGRPAFATARGWLAVLAAVVAVALAGWPT